MTLSENLRMVLDTAGVSEEAYARVCARYTQQPESCTWPVRQVADEGIPHDIGDVMNEVDLAWKDAVNVWFEVYNDMPCYALLVYLRWWERAAPDEVQAKIWAKFREHLSGEDNGLAAPILYTMWCDYFEDPETVEEAWSRLVTDDTPARLLQRVLEASGPVPYSLKASLYGHLIDDPSWHPHILQSLVASQFDYFGQIETNAARDVLASLQLSVDATNLAELRKALGVS